MIRRYAVLLVEDDEATRTRLAQAIGANPQLSVSAAVGNCADARDGAELFVHMANFAVFRHPAISAWDLAMTRLRAVELRRALLRSVNFGLADLVLPSGEWQPGPAAGTSGATCHRAPLTRGLTVYARFGDALFWLCLGLAAVAALGRTRDVLPQS